MSTNAQTNEISEVVDPFHEQEAERRGLPQREHKTLFEVVGIRLGLDEAVLYFGAGLPG